MRFKASIKINTETLLSIDLQLTQSPISINSLSLVIGFPTSMYFKTSALDIPRSIKKSFILTGFPRSSGSMI